MTTHAVADRNTWLEQRLQLLEKEKAFTKLKDELAAARRALPWVKVDKPYTFETPHGMQSLGELFAGRSQLMVYHLMFAPEAELPCKSCSFWADNWQGAVKHLTARDVTLLAVSRGPLAKLSAFKRRQDWKFDWVSSGQTDFNYDFAVSFHEAERAEGKATYNYGQRMTPNMPLDMPGFSVFAKDSSGTVFHTYSTFSRGIELMNATYQLLDLTPKGRDEASLSSNMAWLKYGFDYAESA